MARRKGAHRSMNITVVTPPPFEPVTLAQVYAHLRLDPEGSPATHPDDGMLTRMIVSARQTVEMMTRRALVRQTLRLALGGFPVPEYRKWALTGLQKAGIQPLYLRRPPIVDGTVQVQYFDADNTLQTLPTAEYYVTDEQLPQVLFVNDPPGTYDRPDAVRINYVAGYVPAGSPPISQAEYAANIPAELKDAVLVTVQMLYDSLTPAEQTRLEMLREALVQPYRIQHL